MSDYDIPLYLYPRPRVVASKCLEFESVRYNGSLVRCPTVRDLIPFVDFITVCPEVEIGLGIPRETIRIVKINGQKRLIQPKTNHDLTDEMDNFTDQFLKALPPVDGFIFKSGSPTIGVRNIKIYSEKEKGFVIDHGAGFFADKIVKRYAEYPLEEDDRLRNSIIRHHFLTKLFTFADLRSVKESGSIEKLELFHKYNRFLFRLYNCDMCIKLDELIANRSSSGFDKILPEYEKLIVEMFHRSPGSKDFIRVANEIISKVSSSSSLSNVSSLEDADKGYLNCIIKKYEDNLLSCDALLDILRLYVMRFSDSKEEFSRLFFPYPEELKNEVEPDRDRDFWENFPIPNNSDQDQTIKNQ
ncbi:YbgA family protein [Methanococcoides sp. FTZ1]|uniref:YbgA family protein n=1 Tax=Methanococcoides sp. FTZ1 TaxID=3439061 RepID=UPI003F86711A